MRHIHRARHYKVINKTREYERERSGEVLRSTIRRRRKGPPAYVLDKMSWEERLKDRIVREGVKGQVAEGGYLEVLRAGGDE